ncbi:MAG: bifunctional adenosylcobinamide kinase/adenosylcobinamide-phosphate guanylyltransferase [Burkholderiales bacterium]|nr:bifunctional adenosylcobinamide kinase/adenosylcobinamide-phosphate guanylyltransferase [Burkholderiales bacterium]
MKTLILGGARSGKSRLAERLAHDSGRSVTVVATAQAQDDEMASRIAAHRAARPAHWRCVEEPLALADTLRAADAPGALLLVDCLTLWLSNLLHAGEAVVVRERAALLDALPALQSELLLVGNEVGHGIVPLGALNRRFVDENGWLHQALAEHCDAVRFVMAGCTLALKG